MLTLEHFSVKFNCVSELFCNREHGIVLLFNFKFHRLKAYLLVFSAVVFLLLLTINHLNPIAYGESGDAYLFMTPPMYIAKETGELFDIAVNISNVENLRSLEFTVAYNTSLLDVAQVVQGTFFPSPQGSYFEFEKNESLGFVKVNMSLTDSETPRSGNGTLAWISFEVVQGPESCVSSPLDLQQTLLLNSALIPITHDSVGAVYFWRSMQPDPPVEGRLLDLYTQKGGEGSNEPGGEFGCGENVYLISNVTYNSYPVQQKLVAFEVRNPLNQSVVFRTAITDQDGLAEISFRILGIPSNNGTWAAISVVEIAEETVWDTTSFRVDVTMPIGGYSFPIEGYTAEKPLTLYLSIVTILAAVFTMIRRETYRGLRRSRRVCKIFSVTLLLLLLLLLLLEFNVPSGTSEESDILITDFYSCDALGDPQDYFPRKTTVYFNISVRNFAHVPKNVSIHLSIYDELGFFVGSDQLNTAIPPDVSTHYIMSIFIPKWAVVGIATAYASVWVEGTPVDSESTRFYIGPEDLIPPVIHLLSPENVTYETDSVPLVFTVDERTTWMGYSLNNLENVTIAGNTTLASLTNGPYSIVVHANDTSGNVGSSEEVHFTILIVHDVAVIDLKCSSAEVYVGQIVNVTVVVQNEGTATETFNVTTYANTTIIKTLTITNLPPTNQTTLVFAWNTTGSSKGNYTMRAYVPPVPSETDTTDNTYIDDIVNVMLPPNIAVTNVIASITSVGQGYSISINVTVENQGDYTENFTVTAYANTTGIQTKTVTLTSGNSITVTFTWNTTDFAKGNYTISAYVTPIPYETDITDNTFINGWVFVTIAGDVTSVMPGIPDGSVDMRDIGAIFTKFMTTPTDPEWNPNMDINGDNVVNMRDISIACGNFMK